MKKLLITFGMLLMSSLSANAVDNVLQAVQIDGIKDTYNIVLRADDKVEYKKTIQAPNRMILDLKGIRPSKSINTIYNNSADVDTVMVEAVGDDGVRVFIQADNVNNAIITFDTLRTPIAALSKASVPKEEIKLSEPIKNYAPVVKTEDEESESPVSVSETLGAVAANPYVQKLKDILKDDKISMIVTSGLLAIIFLSGIKLIKGKDDEIHVGLSSRNLRERESGLSGDLGIQNTLPPLTPATAPVNPNLNYGLRAYQTSEVSPFMSSDIPRRPQIQPQIQPQVQMNTLKSQTVQRNDSVNPLVQNIVQTLQERQAMTSQIPSPPPLPQKPLQQKNVGMARMSMPSVDSQRQAGSIDSMKFLESMTKIYEKSGRADLAQGLKNSMTKVQSKV